MTVDDYVSLMMDAAVDAKLVFMHSSAASHTPSPRHCVVTHLSHSTPSSRCPRVVTHLSHSLPSSLCSHTPLTLPSSLCSHTPLTLPSSLCSHTPLTVPLSLCHCVVTLLSHSLPLSRCLCVITHLSHSLRHGVTV